MLHKIGLRERLILGFVSCAFVTVVAIIVGYISLEKTNKIMKLTAKTVNESIHSERSEANDQNDVRNCLNHIQQASTIDNLAKVNEMTAMLPKDDCHGKIITQMNKLICLRKSLIAISSMEEEIIKQRNLARKKLENENKALLSCYSDAKDNGMKLDKISTELKDSIEFEAIISIEDGSELVKSQEKVDKKDDKIYSKMSKVFTTIGSSVSSIKAINDFMNQSRSMSMLMVKILLSEDAASVKYISSELNTLKSNIEKTLNELSNSNEMSSAKDALEKLSNAVIVMGAIKTKIISLQSTLNEMDIKNVNMFNKRNEIESEIADILTTKEGKLSLTDQLSLLDKSRLKSMETMASDIQSTQKQNEEQLTSQKIVLWIVGVISVIVALVIGWFVYSSIVNPIRQMCQVAKSFSVGNFAHKINYYSKDEIGQMADGMRTIAYSQKEKAELAMSIAYGDLTHDVKIASEEDVLGKALHQMILNLSLIVRESHEASEQVAVGAEQISDITHSLSEGAIKSAASLEEITSTLNEIGYQSKQNAENAAKANEFVSSVSDSAKEGNKKMGSVVSAMNNIKESSEEITKIIKTIDDIAFQTNILALNAAVEAAHAGRYGRGFAIVAEEVRNLAARSASAAHETAVLIESAIVKIDDGALVVEETKQFLDKIVDGISKSVGVVCEISAASEDQSQCVTQASVGLNSIDQITQQNTACAEETASATIQLTSRAINLREALSKFRLS